jgi:DNA-3-methyladenine glycosylase
VNQHLAYSSGEVLGAAFFDRPADAVAHDLIGCRFHFGQAGCRIVTETEAYVGPEDLASHAAKGRTKRNEPMFGPPGVFYIYRIYGLHWRLNVVTGPIEFPDSVLIRSLQGIEGPGRVTKALDISGELNGQRASKRTGYWFTSGTKIQSGQIQRTSRIGVAYAGPLWSLKPYRFRLVSER